MKTHLDRGAWLTLMISALMLAWATAGTLYFFSLPTDGWLVKGPPASDPIGLVYTQNAAGAFSDLQPGDQVLSIEGITPNQGNLTVLSGDWQAGNSFNYTVLRGGSKLEVTVSLMRWSFILAVQVFVKLNGGISGVIGQIILLIIAGFTFFRRPTDHAAHALLLLASLVIFSVALVNLFISNPAIFVFSGGNLISILPIMLTFTVLFPPTILRLSLVFPHPKPIVQRHPILEYVPFFIGLVMVPAFFLTNGIASWLWSVVSIVASIAILIHSAITMRDVLSRAQLLWGLWGMIASFLLLSLTFLANNSLVSGITADFFSTLSNLSYGVLGLTLSVAILRYRLWDIDLIIRRTLQYGLLTLLLGLVYFGMVVLLEQIFRAITGQNSPLAVVLSTLTIVVLFTPLRRRIQTTIDRRFYRQKYSAEQAVAAFAAAARSEVELEALRSDLVITVRESLEPESVSLWLKKPENKR